MENKKKFKKDFKSVNVALILFSKSYYMFIKLVLFIKTAQQHDDFLVYDIDANSVKYSKEL